MKKHQGFIIFFAAVLLIFLGKIIFMKGAFLNGDYAEQFYPWSMVYSEAIKNLQFPFWTRYFHSGFPLMAEGQVGGFYPLHIVMFFLLPFKVAYNYLVVFHFIIAGAFTYLYTKKLGADSMGGALAALCFCFGSAYAGCFYNIVTLKTLAWFPLVLLLFEYGFSKKRVLYFLITGCIAGMQFLAGFLQMAGYAFLFYIVYMLVGFSINRIKYRLRLVYLSVFAVVVFIFSMPQVLLTLKLVEHTARGSATLGFALWGSFAPPLLLSAFFPYWFGMYGQQLFIGSLSVLFLIYGILRTKDSPNIRPLLVVGVLSFLMALGRYNPLYVLLLKMTEFYGMRKPAKFLFFSLFAMSVFIGLGFSLFFKNKNAKKERLATNIFLYIASLSLLIFSFANLLLRVKKEWFFDSLRNYVQTYVIGHAHHRYSVSEYMSRIPVFYENTIKNADPTNIFVFISIVMILLGIFIAVYILKKTKKPSWLKPVVFSIIFLDIFAYSFYGTGFRGNIKSFDYIKPTHTEILATLKADKELFRVLPFGLRDEGMPFWMRPNANILVGLDSVAGYTPLAKADYREKLKSLEVLDDSLGLLISEDEALVTHYQSLRLLNVKYIISVRDLRYRFLEKIVFNDGFYLYSFKDYLPRIFFTNDISSDMNALKVEQLNIMEYRDGFVKVELSVRGEGLLVFSENHDPGWEAFVDGHSADIIKVNNLIQAVKITKGTHTVIFIYKPNYLNK